MTDLPNNFQDLEKGLKQNRTNPSIKSPVKIGTVNKAAAAIQAAPAMIDADIAPLASITDNVPVRQHLGATIETAEQREKSALKSLSLKRGKTHAAVAGLRLSVGELLDKELPLRTFTQYEVAGLAIRIKEFLSEQGAMDSLAATGRAAKLASLSVSEAISVIYTDDDEIAKTVKEALKKLGMVGVKTQWHGYPNIPALIALAVTHRMTVFRIDSNHDRICYIKKGVVEADLTVLDDEHANLVRLLDAANGFGEEPSAQAEHHYDETILVSLDDDSATV